MGILTAYAAYRYGRRRQSRRHDLNHCDRCGFHVDDHIGWKQLCPEPVPIYYIQGGSS